MHIFYLKASCIFFLGLEFSGQEIRSTVIFNPVEQSSVALEEEEDSELKGPVVRSNCLKIMFNVCWLPL